MPRSSQTDFQKTTGPSWWDVKAETVRQEKHYGSRIEFVTTVVTTREGRSGLRIVARHSGATHPFGCGSFGEAFPGTAQTTMAAAYYRALLALEEERARMAQEASRYAQTTIDEIASE